MKRFLLINICLLTCLAPLYAQVLYGTTFNGGNAGAGTINKVMTDKNTLVVIKSLESHASYSIYTNFIQASDGKLYGMTAYGGDNNAGIIYSFDPLSSSYKKLRDLDSANGSYPYGSLMQAGNGKLYGTTYRGGSSNVGVIFSFDPSSSIFTKLKDLSNLNGYNPTGNLIQATNGKLYGMTSQGGTNDAGVIFSFDPVSNVYTKLKDLEDTIGAVPNGSLLQANDGKLYGVTNSGGNNGSNGVIFSFDLSSSKYSKLKEFDGTNGSNPYGSLVQSVSGVLYGMTSTGGSSNNGVIFSFDPSSLTYTKLRDFNNQDGNYPYGSLIQATNGKLYGMTSGGGSKDKGVIFSFDLSSLSYTKVKEFDSSSDGGNPGGSLLQLKNGKLYGLATYSESTGSVIFSLEPVSGAYTKLKDIASNETGSNIAGSLLFASNGQLFGTTSLGGSNGVGVIFSLDTSSFAYKKLKDFDYINGVNPNGTLIQASDGLMYGMTQGGGTAGNGTIFSFNPSSSILSKIKDFENSIGTKPTGGLIQASDGKLYGMTRKGGSKNYGVIFSFDPGSSVYKKLKDFDYTNGGYPVGSLIQGKDKKLYGLTNGGGNNNVGVIFSFDPSSLTYKKLKSFDDINGEYPEAGLIQASDGKLYGLTTDGGSNFTGVIFSFDPLSSVYKKLRDFDYSGGVYPLGSLVQAGDGKMYGMTTAGGSNNAGVIFSFDPATANYKKLKDFNGANGANPYSAFIENKVQKCTTCNILEAEDAVLAGAVVANSTSGYTGGGYADYQNTSGAYIEWTTNMPVAGSYSLKFRYANGASTGRPLKLEINGVVIATGLAFSPTGNWITWDFSSATVNLTAGVNKIRLTTIGFDGPNIDHLEIEIVQATFEAENATLNGAIVANSTAGYTGSGYADYQRASGDYIEWTVDFSAAASYSLQFRYANGDAANRPLKLEINGVVVNANLPFLTTGSWTNWSVSSATVNLISGTNKIKLTTAGFNGPNIDHLVVQIISTCQSGLLEAEAAVLKGAIVTNSTTGYTGTGYADYQNAAGDYIEWTVNTMKAGLFSLNFRYANGAPDDRPLKLEINGTVVISGLAFPSTGGWTVWAFSSITVNLPAGPNKIRLTTTGFNGPNIDHLSFSCSSAGQLNQQDELVKKLASSSPFLSATIAPNPVDGYFAKLLLRSSSESQIDLQIIDILGRNAKVREVIPGSSRTFDFPVNDLPPGYYTIILTQGNLAKHVRLIIGKRQ